MNRFIRTEFHSLASLFWDSVAFIRNSRGVFRLLAILFFCNPIVWIALSLLQLFFDIAGMIRDRFASPPDFSGTGSYIEESWLESQVSVEQAERKNSSYSERPIIDGIPFGFMNACWKHFVASMEEQDELWYYHSKRDGHPEWGYAIVREGKPIARFQSSPDW